MTVPALTTGAHASTAWDPHPDKSWAGHGVDPTNPQAIQGWFNSVMEQAKVVVNPQVKLVPGAVSPARAFSDRR